MVLLKNYQQKNYRERNNAGIKIGERRLKNYKFSNWGIF